MRAELQFGVYGVESAIFGKVLFGEERPKLSSSCDHDLELCFELKLKYVLSPACIFGARPFNMLMEQWLDC